MRLADRLLSAHVLRPHSDGTWRLEEESRARLLRLGLDPAQIASAGRRPLVRACLDWTEHRPHVAGRLGAAICTHWLPAGIVRRVPRSRAVRLTPAAEDWLARL